MKQPKQESHIRSIVKGISWRLVATIDTILVVLLVTCLFGECSLELAGMIAGAEFILKLLIYYVHERIWEFNRRNKEVSTKQTLIKSLSWRAVATTTTFLISGFMLDSYTEVALLIAGVELFTKFVLYYLHERLWLRIPLGDFRKMFK